jgi:hypothetical protein
VDTETIERDVLKVWEFWNECSIVKHREFKRFEPTIRGRLRYYSVSELCQAIRNYKDILVSERHWFSYAWTLKDFLLRPNALDNFVDREVALNKYRRRKIMFDDDQADDGADFYKAINKEEFGAPDVHK